MDCFTFSWLVVFQFLIGGVLVRTSSPPKVAIGYAHSKLILTGEHAVVYGFPAIAIPFPLEVTSIVERYDGEIMLACSYYFGPIDKAPEPLKGIVTCIKKTLKYLKKPFKGLLIRLHSEIPLGRGLGSSAAIAVATVKSLFLFYEKSIIQEKLMELVQVAEVYAHGNPSGIDMEAVSSKFPIFFQKGRNTLPLPVAVPFHLVVADSGKMSDTLTAVKKVKENYSSRRELIKNSMERIGEIGRLAKAALLKGDSKMLGRLLDANHQELITLGVSNDHLNILVHISRNEGALGVKMTGGGCGGCIIALARSRGHAEQIAKRLLDAGAEKTWFFTIEKNMEELKGIPF